VPGVRCAMRTQLYQIVEKFQQTAMLVDACS
jgi:hypothetical protein